MNPSRLVAAVAALAVGFGITLVGTTLADSDDADPVASTVGEADPDEAADADVADDEAEQYVTEVAEPAEATTETEPDPSIDEPDAAEAEPVDVEPDDSVDVASTEPASNDQVDAERDPTSSGDSATATTPEIALDCFDVVVVRDDFFGDLVLEKGVDYQLVEGEFEILDDALDVDASDLAGLDEVSIAVSGDRVISCSDSGAVDDEAIQEYALSAQCFVDTEQYFVEFIDDLDVGPGDGVVDDEDVFVYVVAERLERVNPGSDDFVQFRAGVDRFFAGFAAGCSANVVASDLDTLDFFCAAGNLSSTDELLGYLATLGVVSQDCDYDA